MAYDNDNLFRHFMRRFQSRPANQNEAQIDGEEMPQDPEVAAQIKQAYLKKLREKGYFIDNDGGIGR